jgi:hypothetical protein
MSFVEVLSCRGNPNCNLWVTWDLTEEARRLAGQGGGELDLSLDPIPPTVSGPGGSSAWYVLFPDVNYPWTHGGSDGALTVVFDEDCPKQLDLKVPPDSLPPRIPPGNTMTEALTNAPTQATVEALVKSCPSEPGTPQPSVEVSFRVEPPGTGSPDAGGHVHNAARPKGSFERDQGPTETTCVTQLDAGEVGSCSVTYHPSEVSGKEKIAAQATGYPDASKDVVVEVPGLENLAAVVTNFWRLTGQTAGHPDNRWGTAATVNSIQLVALDFLEYSCETLMTCAALKINDLSLRQGGLFDICGSWNPADTCQSAPRGGHRWHRTGTGVDIESSACLDPNLQGTCSTTIGVPRDFIERKCQERGRGRLVREASIHCEWPQ